MILKRIAQLAFTKPVLVVAVLALGALAVVQGQYGCATRQAARATRIALEATTKQLGGVVGELTSQRAIVATLRENEKRFVRELQNVSKRARVDSSIRSTVAVRGVIEGAIRSVPDPVRGSLSTTWRDARGRFELRLPDGPLLRNERFSYRAVIVRSPDGRSRLLKDSFLELDPATGEPISDEVAPTLETSFAFTEEKAEVGYFHPRLVAGFSLGASPVVGAQLLNLERLRVPTLRHLTLAGLVGWDRGDQSIFAAAQLGYRILGSNVSAGPYYGASSTGGPVAGIAVTIEVTR